MTETQTDLTALLDKVRSATGPDRDLDVTICLSLNYVDSTDADLIGLRRSEDDAGWMDYEVRESGKIVECTDLAPPLTASIDAALALTERMLGDHWFGVLLDAARELGGAGTEPPSSLPRYIVAATLTALIAGAKP